jgi:hypothetical protein
VEPLAERILGRVTVHDIIERLTGGRYPTSGSEIKEDTIRRVLLPASSRWKLFGTDFAASAASAPCWPQPGRMVRVARLKT